MDTTIGPNKAIATGVVGAAITIIIFVLGQLHITISPELATALTVLAGTAATWFTPHS